MHSKREYLFVLTETETKIANYLLSNLEEVKKKTDLRRWAKELDIKYSSLRIYLQHIREKYGVNTTQELISEIATKGLITEDDIEFKEALSEIENINNCNKF